MSLGNKLQGLVALRFEEGVGGAFVDKLLSLYGKLDTVVPPPQAPLSARIAVASRLGFQVPLSEESYTPLGYYKI